MNTTKSIGILPAQSGKSYSKSDTTHIIPADGKGFGYCITQPEFIFRIKVHTIGGTRCLPAFPVVAKGLGQALKRATAVGMSVYGAKKVDVLQVKEVGGREE